MTVAAQDRDKRLRGDTAGDRLEALLERALASYHQDERHGGADWQAEGILDAELVPVARQAFAEADDLPPDEEVLQALDQQPMDLLGEGYHVIALVEPRRRFVVKYAKSSKPVPPLGDPTAASCEEWQHDHGVRSDGSLHPAIWQHIRAFEAYGPLAAPNRVYIADRIFASLAEREGRALERFRSIGIVRSLGADPRPIRVHYPHDFPHEKRAVERLTASVLVVQPMITPVSVAIERALRAGDTDAARSLQARYREFTHQLWQCGVSHLDFSLMNIGVAGSGASERLQIFDPHIGTIDLGEEGPHVHDPLSSHPSAERPVDKILRSSRDGSRWALWRVQQDVTTSDDVPEHAATEAATLVRDFHAATEGIEEGQGEFGFERFNQSWEQRRTHVINTVMHAELWALVQHRVAECIRSVLEPLKPDSVYNRSLAVLGMFDDDRLPQFRGGLRTYNDRPLLIVANILDDATEKKHWGRVMMPAELDVQHDPAIHYHLRDLFTGEVFVRPGDDLARRGFVAGLSPREVHVLQVEDITVCDLAVEQTLAVNRDIAEFLPECTKRVGVVGDVHGELQSLIEILRALGFIDGLGSWHARDGTLVFTGDIGHGRHLQEVFDFIRQLAAQAHRVGGRIVWTLGNHDLYADREGGQGGEESLGYRLWPSIREAALHPERHPGLHVQAAYSEYGKLFVHAGLLPAIVDLAERERGARDAETVASYVNDVLRATLVERERIRARDLPHEIFHIGTSHTRERRLPGEIGYEPAGVFTPDLREVDHYRYHAELLPQVVGHTASKRGEIRYAPGSWRKRDYIAIDVGRQHGTGNGALLLTDFGWVAVTPNGPARLVEVSPLFIELARKAAVEPARDGRGAARVGEMFASYFQVARPERNTFGKVRDSLFVELSPAQVVALSPFLANVRQTGRCALVTHLDENLTLFSADAHEEDGVDVLAGYLEAGGVVVFSTVTTFEWLFARLLRPLIAKLGPRSALLSRTLLVLADGRDVLVFEDGAYRRVSNGKRDRAAGFDLLVGLSREGRLPAVHALEPESAVYVGDSTAPGWMDPATGERVGVVIDVGDTTLDATDKPMVNVYRAYRRTLEVMLAATAALRATSSPGRATQPPPPPEVGETVLWTFERPRFPSGSRVRVRVKGSGFVHAGVSRPEGNWSPAYNVPLVPVEEGQYEAVLPAGVDVFTFFWTEAPWSPGRPGHWERAGGKARLFRAAANS